ncbi:3423_t:CDS:2 [Cetraspora pellucida]|uniref:3423_t:CDS:1 n=1 Tax=Cetraspora pellucida TaxID=1433469 RepID=A0ACA9JYA4_9GLOM|nr:3423_t:CDS:2 [Cetraspora pellucida]
MNENGDFRNDTNFLYDNQGVYPTSQTSCLVTALVSALGSALLILSIRSTTHHLNHQTFFSSIEQAPFGIYQFYTSFIHRLYIARGAGYQVIPMMCNVLQKQSIIGVCKYDGNLI